MPDPNYVLLYVASIPASAKFYAELLGKQPVESSPTFVMFALDRGVMLGLWRRDTVEPGAELTGGGAELCFAVENPAAVRATHEDWRRRGLTIAQAPTQMDFGTTFVALDPDRHRLRVFAPVAP